ncbi:MAG: isoprenylcysteine carboxylmethyltransferase family protein [Gemmatimonadaceae bacterium]|nr:isoprenylcysteine carboxylmethyltransferase family protein [Gemmatimonadaceae bacterium]
MSDIQAPASADSAGDQGPAVRFPPPLVFVAGYLLGVALMRVWPWPLPAAHSLAMRLFGVSFVIAGVSLALVGVVTFKRARVAVYPNRAASALVTHGLYRYTRNPMYLGMTIAYVGGTLLTAMTWALVLLPLVLLVLYQTVMRKEERHLHERFPQAYAEYRASVRRWL